MGKVFLSYSHKDEDFVKDLYRRLTRDGVDCFFDKESIEWGANWVIELENGIDVSDNIILVLSPDFCRSEWTKIERTSSMADDPGGLKKRLRPLLLEPCGDLLPRFLKPIQHIDVSTPEKFDAAYPKICQSLGATPIGEGFLASSDTLPPISRLPDRSRMPYRSLGNGFVGRVSDLWNIHDILLNRKAAVVEGVGIIMGTGGIGKTQLAIEYVHRFGVNYPGGVFWVDADEGIATMINQITRSAGIEIDSTQKEKDQLIQLWGKLSRFHRSLIVLDNFPEREPLKPWLPPSGSIYVLVTTRRRDLNLSRIPLGFMTVDDGIKLLSSGERKFSQEAKGLVEALGGLPLALELAKNFLNLRSDLSIQKILQEIQRMGELTVLSKFADQYADELPSGHTKEVAATFQMSWDLASPHAKQVLQVMALLAPKPVPVSLIRKALSVSTESILEDPVAAGISELARRLSLVELDREGDPAMHRLILGFVRTRTEGNRELQGNTIRAIIDEMARVHDDRDVLAYQQLEKVVPHAELLLSSEDVDIEGALDITDCLRRHHLKWGRYRLAEQFGRKSLELAEKNFEPGHPSIAISQSNLALVLQKLGELKEARDLLTKALASDEKNFEPGHPSIAISQSNLALVLKELGELKEARDLLTKALASAEKNFEPGHPSIAISQSNLALVLKELGELKEARDLLTKAYEVFLEKLGYDHPYTKTVRTHLLIIIEPKMWGSHSLTDS
jgi:tetratricopeptide (TPR) repeat protein